MKDRVQKMMRRHGIKARGQRKYVVMTNAGTACRLPMTDYR